MPCDRYLLGVVGRWSGVDSVCCLLDLSRLEWNLLVLKLHSTPPSGPCAVFGRIGNGMDPDDGVKGRLVLARWEYNLLWFQNDRMHQGWSQGT